MSHLITTALEGPSRGEGEESTTLGPREKEEESASSEASLEVPSIFNADVKSLLNTHSIDFDQLVLYMFVSITDLERLQSQSSKISLKNYY